MCETITQRPSSALKCLLYSCYSAMKSFCMLNLPTNSLFKHQTATPDFQMLKLPLNTVKISLKRNPATWMQHFFINYPKTIKK